MIKYKLACKNCKTTFDSWFASSNEFEKLKKKRLLVCHICNSKTVDKTLMAPSLRNNKKDKQNGLQLEKYENVKKTIKSYQKFIKENEKRLITLDEVLGKTNNNVFFTILNFFTKKTIKFLRYCK